MDRFILIFVTTFMLIQNGNCRNFRTRLPNMMRHSEKKVPLYTRSTRIAVESPEEKMKITTTKRRFILTKVHLIIIGVLLLNFKSAGQAVFDSTYFAQDTTRNKAINFTPDSAALYIEHLIGLESLWKKDHDSIKSYLTELVGHYETPFDSIRAELQAFDFQKISFDTTLLVEHDTLPLRWLNDSLFFVDTLWLDQSPYFTQKTIRLRSLEPDSSLTALMDSIPDIIKWIDSIITIKDTITKKYINFAYLKSKNITLHTFLNGIISPPFEISLINQDTKISADSSALIIINYSRVLRARDNTPFRYLPGGNMPDSLQTAITTLLEHTWNRDSVQIFLSGRSDSRIPFWLSSKKPDLYRHWIRNTHGDSITVWLGNPSKFDISMLLEEKINVERLGIIPTDDITFTTSLPDLTPASLKPLKEIPDFWDLSFDGSFSINQNYITYWAQGGESSFAGLIDIAGSAKYVNNETKSNWVSSGRMRFGSVSSKEKGLRINTDIIEINSQYNKIMINKLDFSSTFYFKTQLAKGYNYPNDSVPVSEFLNPGTFTIGIGAEYKPVENTLINLSPLSYKNTFVSDTTNIDQTVHGVDANKKAKQEIGGQLLIKNKLTLFDEVKVANSLRLFSNYADNPQNLDVDWEMSIERRITWIFSVRLNIHLIYDDDIRFPVELPDGGEKKAPRTQFNQFLGLSLTLNL